MATLLVAAAAAAGGVVAGKKLAEKGGAKRPGEDADDPPVAFNTDAYNNHDCAKEAKAMSYLAMEYPSVHPHDVNTPDNWIKRHPSLIRLTGKHPFNVEAPPAELYDHGFISPVNLHVVRNHGAVPQLDWATHTISFGGNVPAPFEIGMDELASMDAITFPCLVVCAGNRRKEQNMIKKSIGFNWGPVGIGNTYWTGVPLRVLLNRAGITKPGPGARFVCLAGPEGELPKTYDGQDGGPGSYGTSIDMETALDPTCDVIVAYEQNGKRLHPDHGFPCRVLIPGYIGGRMIKFLSKVIVTDAESKNFYHFNDNRVLPVGVDAERATEEGWWFKEEYIINNLNINGAIIHPQHEETLPNSQKTITIKGYAYSGGGRKVIRAEVSFDQGDSWRLANITVREKPRWAAGSSGDKAKHWCWCHWEYEADAAEVRGANEICFRAFDQSQNCMPERPTWNVMGMLNNPWFRVRVHPSADGKGVTFEHPTIAGPTPGGWMQKMAAEKGGELLWGWGGEGGPAAPPRADLRSPGTPPKDQNGGAPVSAAQVSQ